MSAFFIQDYSCSKQVQLLSLYVQEHSRTKIYSCHIYLSPLLTLCCNNDCTCSSNPRTIDGSLLKWYMKRFMYWTADLKSSKLWASQWWTQFKQLRDLAIPVRRSNQLSHDYVYVSVFARSRVQTPLKSWLFQASIRSCLNCVHNCEDHSLLEFRIVSSSLSLVSISLYLSCLSYEKDS